MVEFEKEELSYIIDYLIDELHIWSEKGFENIEEEERFQRMVSVVCKLREAIGESATLFL